MGETLDAHTLNWVTVGVLRPFFSQYNVRVLYAHVHAHVHVHVHVHEHEHEHEHTVLVFFCHTALAS